MTVELFPENVTRNIATVSILKAIAESEHLVTAQQGICALVRINNLFDALSEAR